MKMVVEFTGTRYLTEALDKFKAEFPEKLRKSIERELNKMAKSKKITGKRNPQDATLRNVRAAGKRLKALEARYAALEERVSDLEDKRDEEEY